MMKFNYSITSLYDFVGKYSFSKKLIVLLILGLFSALSFAPIYFFPAYMIALPVLLIVSHQSKDGRQAVYAGYVFGLGHFFAGLYWIGNSFASEPSLPDWSGYIMVLVLALYLSVFIAFASYGVWRLHQKDNINEKLINIVLTFVILWSVGEWLRGLLFTGFPWNLSGYILGFSDAMLQTTAIWGIYGLSVFVLLLSFVPFLCLTKKTRFPVLGAGVGIILIFYVYGNQRIPEDVNYVEDVNLRIVQANIQQQDKWGAQNWGKNLVTYMEMSEADNDEEPVHVIWPETAVIYSLSEEDLRRQLIARVLPQAGGTVMTGYPKRNWEAGERKVYNSFVAIDPDGGVAAEYDKSHLVPFGEYMPAFIRTFATMTGLDRLFTGGQGFSHGAGIATSNIPGLPPVGVLICYEVIFPGAVADTTNRPDWFLNITNDAWYGDSTGPHQHLLQTRVRSIEEGLPMVRSAGTGISAVIDPYGRVLNKIPLNKKAVINSKLPAKIEAEPLYARLKEWTFACINVILVIANIVVYRRKRAPVR